MGTLYTNGGARVWSTYGPSPTSPPSTRTASATIRGESCLTCDERMKRSFKPLNRLSDLLPYMYGLPGWPGRTPAFFVKSGENSTVPYPTSSGDDPRHSRPALSESLTVRPALDKEQVHVTLPVS